MGHHVADPATAAEWARVCNDLIYRVTTLFPDNFAGVAQLPQVAGEPLDACVSELERTRHLARLRRLQPEPGPVRRLLERRRR